MGAPFLVGATPQSPAPVPSDTPAPGRVRAPFDVGDQIQLRHTCRVNWPGGPARLTPVDHRRVLTLEAVIPLNTGNTWRIEATRCDGTALAVVVDQAGHHLTT
jgi:hypothetical protein